MMITSICREGCQNVSTLTYQWNLFRFFKISPDDVQEKWVQFVNKTYVVGDDTAELTMASDLFKTNPDVFRWKIEFSLVAISKQNGKKKTLNSFLNKITILKFFKGIANGASSLILQLNSIPYGGSCTVSPDNGTSVQTYFTFKCTDWLDNDGTIIKYTFYTAIEGSSIDSGVGESKNGELITQLPQGGDDDGYQLSAYVLIIDNDDGSALFKFPNKLTVEPNMTAVNGIFDSMTGSNAADTAHLFSGNPAEATKNLLALSAALNSQSKEANVSANGKFYKDFLEIELLKYLKKNFSNGTNT